MKKICRICFVMLGVIIAGSLLVKFIFKDDLRNLVKVHWCRQMIQNQELLEEHANALIHQKRGEITEKANKKITETINKKLGKTYIWCALFEDHAIDGNGAVVVYEKKPCFSWIWYDYAYYCGFYYYDNEEPMEVHDSNYYLSRDMETVEPMWWRSHYKTETEKITDHWWFYEVWAKPSQQVRM